MALRVNPDWTQNLLFALGNSRSTEDRALGQIASGRRVNSIGEDPAAAVSFVYLQAATAENFQFLRNMTSLRGSLGSAEEALNGTVLAMTRAIALGVQGFSTTVSQPGRMVVAAELRGVRDQMLALANTSYQGNYLFSGTEFLTRPFTLDAAQPSGVRYDGNSAVNSVEINLGYTLPAQIPGNRIFSDPQTDLFQALNDTITALENGDLSNADQLVSGLRKSFDHLQSQRAVIGNLLSLLNSAELALNRQNIELARQETEIVGADLAAAATDLVKAAQAREAILTASARISKSSLLDYLQ